MNNIILGDAVRTVRRGRTITIDCETEADDICFVSGNPAVAQVSDDGLILGVMPGMSVVTVFVNGSLSGMTLVNVIR